MTEQQAARIGEGAEEFQREERYVVVKISKMHPVPTFRRRHLAALKEEHADALVDCVVVEHDWPEYETVWRMIEARMAGKQCTNCPGATDHDTAHCPLGAQEERDALAWLESKLNDMPAWFGGDDHTRTSGWMRDQFILLIQEARAALAQPSPAPALEKQEPAGFVRKNEAGQVYIEWLDRHGADMTKRVGMKLYAAPVAQAGQVPEVLLEAIKWADHLLFECGALVQTRAPSVHVYNQTYAAVEAAKALIAAAPAQGGE